MKKEKKMTVSQSILYWTVWIILMLGLSLLGKLLILKIFK